MVEEIYGLRHSFTKVGMSTLVVVTTFHSECSEGILEEVSLMKEDTEMFVSDIRS